MAQPVSNSSTNFETLEKLNFIAMPSERHLHFHHFDWTNLVPLASTSSTEFHVGLTDNRNDWRFWQTISNEMNIIPELSTLTPSNASFHCALIEISTGQLKRGRCHNYERPFFCQTTKPTFRYCGNNEQNTTDWILIGQTCVRLFNDTKMPLKDGLEVCRKAGGRIASITTPSRANLLAKIADEKTQPGDLFFVNAIGGHGGTIISSDIYGNVHNLSIASIGTGDCFSVDANDGSIARVACNSSHFIMCERLSLVEARKTSALFSRKASRKFNHRGYIEVACQKGWSKFNGDCFKVFQTYKTQEEAFDECQQNLAYLTSIKRKEDLDFIGNLISQSLSNEYLAWIGLATGGVEGDWLYLDGSGPPTNIDFNQLPFVDVPVSGVVISSNGTLHVNETTIQLPFVCRKDPAADYYSRPFSGDICPDGMELVNDTCYSTVQSGQTFEDAYESCNEKFGTNLASPLTEARWQAGVFRMFAKMKW